MHLPRTLIPIAAAAVLGHVDLVVESQRPFEHRSHGGLVVDDQDSRHAIIEATYPGSTPTGPEASANGA